MEKTQEIIHSRLFNIGLRFNVANNLSLRNESTNKDMKKYLHVLTFTEYPFLEIDFSLFFYAISDQIQLNSALEDIKNTAESLSGFQARTVEIMDILEEAMKCGDRKQFPKALEILEAAVEEFPDIALLKKELSDLYFRLGKIKKGNLLKNEFIEMINRQTEKQYLEDLYYDNIEKFSTERKNMEDLPTWVQRYKETFKGKYSIISYLSILTNELVEHFQGKKVFFPISDIPSIIQDCLFFLEWLSTVATLIYFHLEYNCGNPELLENLKEEIIRILGWTPEKLPSYQTPNYLSPEVRKHTWEKQLGMDVLSGTAMKSIYQAVFQRIDQNPENDNPDNFLWISKKIVKKMEIGLKMSDKHFMHQEAERKKINDHIITNFGEPLTIIHDQGSGIVHKDIYIIPPDESRDFGLLITSGMSERPMNAPPDSWMLWGIEIPPDKRNIFSCHYAELVIKLPPNWPLPNPGERLKDDEYLWPIAELHYLINYVYKNNEWFWGGHTMSNRNNFLTFSDHTKLAGWVFILPPNLPAEFNVLKINDSKAIYFLQLIPAYIEEIKYAISHGTENLIEKFIRYDIPDYIDVTRVNTCD
jgi:tetratricopeptide (TPR) repeat protein